MGSFDVLLFVRDFAGIIIAAILIFFAGRLLPGRARWFFWTAGFAILIYELYLRINNRRILEELDEQWKTLRTKKERLEEKNETLKKEAEQLSKELDILEKKAAESFQEVEELRTKSNDQQTENKNRLDELERALQDLQKRRDALAEIEEKFNLNSTLIREIDSGPGVAKP